MRRLTAILPIAAILLGGAWISAASRQADGAEETLPALPVPVTELTVPMTVNLTARDFVTKVYGVLDADLSKDEIASGAKQLLNLIPQEDEFGLWLETEDGYRINYYGSEPDVSAMAAFDGGDVADFGFFFLFPYAAGERDMANARQADFCGNLLQEMFDIGMTMGVVDGGEAIFEAAGQYGTNAVDVRLIDEESETDSREGRYIVVLTVEPGALDDGSPMASAI